MKGSKAFIYQWMYCYTQGLHIYISFNHKGLENGSYLVAQSKDIKNPIFSLCFGKGQGKL